MIESKSLMVGTSEQESTFNIEAKLQISPITPCSFVLKVRFNVSMDFKLIMDLTTDYHVL